MEPNPLMVLAGLLFRVKKPEDPALLDALGEWDRRTPEQRRLAQLEYLRIYLRGTIKHSDYYARTLSPVLEARAWSWETFKSLPLINRSTIAEQGSSLRVRTPRAPWTPTGKTSTSGSTGTPIVTEQTGPRSVLQAALARHWHVISGKDFNRDTAFITEPYAKGRADPPDGKLGPTWAGGLGPGRGRLLTLNASPTEQFAWLEKISVPYLVTYPSNLRALLNVTLATGKVPPQIREVMLSSEPIPNALVEDCKNLWNARVTGTYSSSELGAIALQDTEGNYRTTDCSVYVEVLEDDGSPTPVGSVGRVVVTTLQDLLRPLIRYEIGDYAEVARSEDEGILLKSIVGRQRTMIVTKAGRSVWPYFELGELAERGVVKQWQLVQHKDHSLSIRVVASRALTQDDEAAISRSIDQMSGGLPLKVTTVDEIPRTARGKFREVISELD